MECAGIRRTPASTRLLVVSYEEEFWKFLLLLCHLRIQGRRNS